MPPPAPRVCFGRDELIEKVIGMAENLEPIALIGAGGIGKTSIALTVLHHGRIKERFGDDRRFIRCDQFPPSLPHFLARLSKVIGAGIENPEDLTSLRPALSSKEMLLIFDNVEFILDPQGPNAREIYEVVNELCQVQTICVCITSRITMVPPLCKRPEIHQLSRKAACNIFYNIYDDGGRSEIISDLVQRLDFHALSIALLATTASQNMWNYDRMAEEWGAQRGHVLRTDYNESLAATIELSLASPTFRKLGSDARDLLGVIAFFPQGVDEKNLDWFFSAIPDRRKIFDKFCVLSLAYRNNGFVTMLSPIRDYIRPKDPKSSPLLCTTRDHYFTRLSVDLDPATLGFEEARWIRSEDVNVEHLLDVFTSIDPGSGIVWGVCIRFMTLLYWHKPRWTVLAPKVEALPDDHHSKPSALLRLSRLFCALGNFTEPKRLLAHTLRLERQRGDEARIALALRSLSDVNRMLKLYEEGILQAREASEIYERLGDPVAQAWCLNNLAWLLLGNKQPYAAETEASRLIDLIPEKGEEHLVCQSHELLGYIYLSKGEKEKAIYEFQTALGIASRFNWHDALFWIHCDLAKLFRDEGEFDDANAHVKQAESYTIDNPYSIGRATAMRASILRQQARFEDAKSEASHALEIYEKLGATVDAQSCRALLRMLDDQ